MRLSFVALLAIFAPFAAADTGPWPWWSLELSHPPSLTSDEVVVLRSLDAARTALAWQDGVKTCVPSWLSRVDFDAYLVVVIPGPADRDDPCEVVSVSEGKVMVIELIREPTPAAPIPASRRALAILLPHLGNDRIIVTHWTDGTLAEMHRTRDCACGPLTAVAKSSGKCPWCGLESTLGSAGLCDQCAARRQICPDCGKRQANPPPLKPE